MALIKCPECGNMVSDQAKNCIHCGYPFDKINTNPIPQENKEGTVIIYGIKQKFLIGGTMQIYLDGVYYGDVKKNQSIEFKIYKDTEITARCGINVMKGRHLAKVGRTQKLQITYGRIGGYFRIKEIP